MTWVERRMVMTPSESSQADARLRLEVARVDELGAILALHHHGRRAAEGRLHVAPGDSPVGEQIAALVHERRARRERVLGVEHAGHRLVVDVHHLRRRSRLLLRLGGDQGHGLALMPHAVLGQHVQARPQRARRRSSGPGRPSRACCAGRRPRSARPPRPGMAWARCRVRPRMRADGYGERTTTACSIPGMAQSAA